MKTATYSKSDLMKYAWAIYKAQNERTMEAWSICLKKAWRTAKSNPSELKGNKITFEYVYSKYYNDVCRFVNSKVHSKAIAEDITSDTFLKVGENLSTFKGNDSDLKNLLMKIAFNAFVSYTRLKSVNSVSRVSDWVNDEGEEMYQFVGTGSTDSRIMSKDATNNINKAFSKLNDKEQRIANLYFIQNMKYKDIAEVCNVPEGTVKGMINRSRAKLQEMLTNVGVM